MGYGPVTPGGKQLPITPWKGSWAEQEQAAREGRLVRKLPDSTQWPLGMGAKAVRYPISTPKPRSDN